jgi:hypothetical protein
VNLSGCLALTSIGRVSGKFWLVLASSNFARHFTDSFTDSGRSDLPNSLLLMQQNLEARVGIGQFTPRLQVDYAEFYWLLDHNQFNPT